MMHRIDIDKPDARDYHLQLRLGDVVTIPDTIRLDNEPWGNFKEDNQGNSVHCTTYSSYHVARLANELEHAKPLNGLPEQGWIKQTAYGTYSPSGDYVQTALKSIKDNGLITDTETFKIDGYAQINASELDYWLAKGYAVVTSCNVTATNFEKARDTGIWGGNDGTIIGGHAFCIMGKDPDYKIAVNSYGSDWGFYHDGTYRIKNADVNLLGTMYVIYDHKDSNQLIMFSDVTPDRGDYAAINEAKTLGIVHGYLDGTFKPDQPITRGEMTMLLMNLYHLIKPV